MEIKKLVLGHIHSNCYLLSTDNAAVVIDPGFNSQEAEAFFKENKDKEKLILLTHCHFDHIGGANRLREVSGSKIAVSTLDANGLFDPELNFSNRFHAKVEPFCADINLSDNEEITVGDMKIKCLLTPGHSKGSMCFLIENNLFSGDTLFFESVGRTDGPGGSFEEIIKSVKRLCELDENTAVFPGHMENTTIYHEKYNNPFLRY